MAGFRDLKNARQSRHKTSYGISSSTPKAPISPPSQQSEETTQDPIDASTLTPSRLKPTSESTSASTKTEIPKMAEGKKSEISSLYADELKNASLEVWDIPGRGRGLVAGKKFKPGSRILKTPTATSVLSTPHLTTTCHGCFLTPSEKKIILASSGKGIDSAGANVKLNRCSGCKTLHYCSRECQLTDWPSHKSECKALSRLRTMYHLTYPSRQSDASDVRWAGADAIRALGRICWTRRSKLVERDGGDWWTRLEGMESHVKQMQPEEAMKLGNQTQHLAHYLSASDPLQPDSDPSLLEPADMQTYGFNSVAEVIHLCSAMKVNAFTLTSPSLTPIGISISPLLALANHSCAPNAVAVFPRGGGEIDLVAISDIAPGSETSQRRTTSANPNCSTATVSPVTVLYASSPNAGKEEEEGMKNGWTLGGVSGTLGAGRKVLGGYLVAITSTGKVGTKCNSCGDKFDVDNDALKALIQQGYELLEKEENGTLDPSPALQTLSTLLPQLLSLSPPSSHPLLALLHLSALLLSPPKSPSSLSLATQHLALASSASFLSLPPNHPSTAVTLAKWGKLLSLDQVRLPSEGPEGAEMLVKRLEMATVVLRKALTAAELGFGAEGGVVGLEMDGLVKGCEGELGVYRAKKRGLV
ncbi:hypothetical protein L198_08061 [Cryptococcus wingfieldii CBS 7118]|uniref:MYND-type domain-containing protein n=1 Tax=Cryptococcus wingfieldii CBS 7118 TaxID=1295528 RepID=A0A1E3HL78_9TREE|nr:hypothetical protein L198_08061 [Cryptococcus wingfieldii CBS 7118]ODN76466.1 hypothetical protein L198_08061 [Cryptococcus wingfieldii CBS 7118]